MIQVIYALVYGGIMCLIASVPLAILGIWLFGLRPYVARNGRARVTAAHWYLSMWADWTTAREIGNSKGKQPWCSTVFWVLWLVPLGFYVIAIAISIVWR